MNGFVSRLISRHTSVEGIVVPRLPATFEPVGFSANAGGDLLLPGNDQALSADIAPLPITRATHSHNSHDQNPISQPQSEIREAIGPGFSHHANPFQHMRDAELNTVRPRNGEVDAQRVSGVNDNHNAPHDEARAETSVHTQLKTGEIYEHEIADTNRNARHDDSGFESDGISNVTKAKTAESYDDTMIKHDHSNIRISSHGNEISKERHPALINPVIKDTHLNIQRNSSEFHFHQSIPAIRVSIGRIEVRAINNSAPAKVNREMPSKPRMSLEDYLRSRNNGGQ